MKLAFYKGPTTDGLAHAIAHWFTRVVTMSRYSHVELVIDGVCYTSSVRDAGVRGKAIDLDSGHWDVVTVPTGFSNEAAALAWFQAHRGQKYDWLGVLRFAPFLRWLRRRPNEWFCSEAIAAALGLDAPDAWTPGDLAELLMDILE